MGPSKFHIEILGNGIVSYFPGQTIEGILHVTTTKECKIEGINVTFEGKATVHWTETQRVAEQKGKRKTRTMKTVHYAAEQIYFNCKINLMGSGVSGSTTKYYLQPAQHRFPFQFSLPQGLPTSFIGTHGMVSYEINADMKKVNKAKIRSVKLPITVNGIVDLNVEPGASGAMEARKFKNLCCFCCKSGPIGFILRLPRKGFVSGEFLKFTAELNNQSSRKVNGVTIYLVQIVSYHATQKTKTVEKTICKAKGPAVEAGDSEIWTGNVLQIPALPPTRLANCKIIDVQYMLKIEMDLAGPAINLRHEIPIIIGSIPLRNTFGEIQTLQRPPPKASSSSGRKNPAPAPPSTPSSPKAVESTDWKTNSSQASYFQENYPDMPPPTYSETIMQDQFNLRNAGNQNPGYSNETEDTANDISPSAPPADTIDFAPKYITYAWQTDS